MKPMMELRLVGSHCSVLFDIEHFMVLCRLATYSVSFYLIQIPKMPARTMIKSNMS